MGDPPLPAWCPSCGGEMEVVRLECSSCATDVTGRYRPCPVCRLDSESRDLFERFLDARGNLKEVQRGLGVSYPTVRQRIDALFAKLDREPVPTDPVSVLRQLREGRITIEQAEALLRRSG